MSLYKITVNGKSYEVEVEELPESYRSAGTAADVQSQAATDAQAAPVQSSSLQAKEAEIVPAQETTPSAAPAGSTAVLAPMPGTILDVKVEKDQSIAANTVLCILEAMKMENEIIFPKAGTVVQVAVSKGKTVNAGDLLFSIQE